MGFKVISPSEKLPVYYSDEPEKDQRAVIYVRRLDKDTARKLLLKVGDDKVEVDEWSLAQKIEYHRGIVHHTFVGAKNFLQEIDGQEVELEFTAEMVLMQDDEFVKKYMEVANPYGTKKADSKEVGHEGNSL